MQGIGRPGDFRKGAPLSENPVFGQPVNTPREFGNNVGWNPSPAHFGNTINWSPSPAHFGNTIDLSLGPFIQSISPTAGPAGTTVTISGNGFLTGAIVSFGVDTTAATVVSAQEITCTAPANTNGGTAPVTILVTNTDGQMGLIGNAFTY